MNKLRPVTFLIDGYSCEFQMVKAGSSGVVFKVRKLEKEYCLKRLADGLERKTKLLNFESWKRLDSPFLVKFVESFRFCEGSASDLVVVSEWCHGVNLRDAMKRNPLSFDHQRIMRIFLQLLFGLRDLYKLKLIHGDLRPENVFLNDDDFVKITDFGFEKVNNVSDPNKAVTNTRRYYSAEVIYQSLNDEKADSWSLGIMTYEMYTQEMPFPGLPYSLPESAVKEKYEPTLKIKCPDPDMRRIIGGMLEGEVNKRLTVLDVLKEEVVQKYAKAADLEKYLSTSNSSSTSPS